MPQLAPFSSDALLAALDTVAAGAACMKNTVGPAVGCLMATFGTTLIPSTIFEFEDPPELMDVPASQRLELWGLQVRLSGLHLYLDCSVCLWIA